MWAFLAVVLWAVMALAQTIPTTFPIATSYTYPWPQDISILRAQAATTCPFSPCGTCNSDQYMYPYPFVPLPPANPCQPAILRFNLDIIVDEFLLTTPATPVCIVTWLLGYDINSGTYNTVSSVTTKLPADVGALGPGRATISADVLKAMAFPVNTQTALPRWTYQFQIFDQASTRVGIYQFSPYFDLSSLMGGAEPPALVSGLNVTGPVPVGSTGFQCV